jgi:hypothetical protein
MIAFYRMMIPLGGVALVLLAAGCGEPTIAPEDSFEPAELQGTVDTGLPPELQKKQQALYDVLSVLQRGVAVDDVSGYTPNVRFQETPDSFLPSGTLDLARWAFDGKPTGNDVPVVMHFTLDTPGGETKEEKRVYTVTGAGGRMVIRRKP